jgi:plastocyanin
MALYSSALRCLAGTGLFLMVGVVSASSISIQVTNSTGQPLVDAVVYAEPLSGQAAPRSQRTTEIEQKGKKFLPMVTVIQTGGEISFPNHDTVRHHVYSFSPAKTFELPLYAGVPGTPITFDKAGTVVVGCNIHDRMVAYIHVVNTPYFGKTDAEGKVKLDGLVAGKYQLSAWYFGLPTGAPIPEQPITLTSGDTTASFKLNTKVSAPVPASPPRSDVTY